MNLNELLNYRQTCLIHGTKLNAYYDNHDSECRFQCHFNDNELLEAFQSNLYIYMMCESCERIPINKERSLGFTTLMDIKIIQYYYTFWYDPNLKTGTLNFEKVKYVNDEKFYHIDANLANGKAFCRMGSFKAGTTVDDMLGSFMNLELPKLNMKSINDTSQLISRIKLWSIFS